MIRFWTLILPSFVRQQGQGTLCVRLVPTPPVRLLYLSLFNTIKERRKDTYRHFTVVLLLSDLSVSDFTIITVSEYGSGHGTVVVRAVLINDSTWPQPSTEQVGKTKGSFHHSESPRRTTRVCCTGRPSTWTEESNQGCVSLLENLWDLHLLFRFSLCQISSVTDDNTRFTTDNRTVQVPPDWCVGSLHPRSSSKLLEVVDFWGWLFLHLRDLYELLQVSYK